MLHSPTALTYRPDIDGLRALAVGIVVLFHADLGFPGGYVGVDVFFVISGFLITSLLLKDLDANRFSLATFYERRARRILPASLVVTALVLAAGWRLMLPSDFEWLGLSAVAHAACAANVFFLQRTSNYFAGSAAEMPLLHMWSLAVEEQFYLVFPLLLWGAYRMGLRSRKAIGWTLGALAAVSLLVSNPGHWFDINGAFYLLPTRAWELLIGAWLATRPVCAASRLTREIATWIGAACVLVPAMLYSSATPFPGATAVPPCVGAALLIWSGRAVQADGRRDQAIIGRLLATRPMVFVGAISYSLYLIHWPILALDKYRALGPASLSHRLLLVGVALALAIVSWRFVEQPFRARRWGATRGRLFAASAAGLAVVAVAGGMIYTKDGFATRFPAAVNDIDQVRRTKLHLAQLEAVDVPDRLTPMGIQDETVPVSVLLWGDSHAGALFPAFNELCKARGLKGRAATRSGRAPLVSYSLASTRGADQAARQFSHAVVDYVRREQIKTVFLVNYWERDAADDAERMSNALEETISMLNSAGATVYVVMQVPSYAVEVPRVLAFEAMRRRPLDGWRKTMAGHVAAQRVMYDLGRSTGVG
jgi:peptidoglycan/LPS O-acetylase OafA/YrhL